VSASYDALVELFERIGGFFNRLGVYSQVSPTAEMIEVIVKIFTEILSVLSIATKEVTRKRASELFLQNILHSHLTTPVFDQVYFSGN
jgi:hypothetical protein